MPKKISTSSSTPIMTATALSTQRAKSRATTLPRSTRQKWVRWCAAYGSCRQPAPPFLRDAKLFRQLLVLFARIYGYPTGRAVRISEDAMRLYRASWYCHSGGVSWNEINAAQLAGSVPNVFPKTESQLLAVKCPQFAQLYDPILQHEGLLVELMGYFIEVLDNLYAPIVQSPPQQRRRHSNRMAPSSPRQAALRSR